MPFPAFTLYSSGKWTVDTKRRNRRVEDSVGKIRPDGWKKMETSRPIQ